MKRRVDPRWLIALAVAGHGTVYVLGIVLARSLGVEGFEAYVIGATAFTLMVTVAPRGVEKFALRLLPALIERHDWPQAHGLLRWGAKRTLWTALLLGGTVSFGVWLTDWPQATKLAIVVSCLALPAGALVHFLTEILTGAGRVVTATAIFRLAVPVTTLASVGCLIFASAPLSGAIAVACWGAAWTVASLLIALTLRRFAPPALFVGTPVEDEAAWSRASRPFLFYRAALALLAHMSVIALDRLQPSAGAVGAYAAAISTVGFAVVLVTATNRDYARQLSILLERGDFSAIAHERRRRLQWLLPSIAALLFASFAFSRELLALFRTEFAAEGVAALRVLAVAAAFTMSFALAPTYLKFRRHNRAISITVACAAAAQLVLLLLLVPRFAATGAAIAYAASMCAMYGTFALIGRRELAGLQRQSVSARRSGAPASRPPTVRFRAD